MPRCVTPGYERIWVAAEGELADWLEVEGLTHVAESTGVS